MQRIPFFIAFVFVILLNQTQCLAQILPAFGGSRTGTTGFQFLKIAPDAKSVGMGEAFTAVTDDVEALFWNPAGITKVDSQRIHLQINHLSYFAGINLESVGAVYRLSDNNFIGLSLVYLNSGLMDVTTEFQPFGTGQTFRAVDVSAGLTFAQILSDNFNYGITLKFIQESIASINTTTAVLDFGFQYNVDVVNARFAVGLNNFGFNAKPKGTIEIFDLAGNYENSEFEQIAAPSIFRIGVAWDPIKRDAHLLTFAGQLNHPTDNNETFNLGGQYTFNNLLIFRTGYQFGLDEFTYPSFGLGINLKRNFGAIKLDYAFLQKERLGTNHRISLGVAL